MTNYTYIFRKKYKITDNINKIIEINKFINKFF